MFHYPSFSSRIFIGFLYGIFISVIAYGSLTFVGIPEHDIWVLCFYLVTKTTLIGLLGIIDWLPHINKRLSWMVRGPLFAIWFGLLFILFNPDLISQMASAVTFGIFVNAYWFLFTCMVIGWFNDLICTHFAGEGLLSLTADKYR